MNVTASFFQQKPDIKPIIYAYELVGVESHRGWGCTMCQEFDIIHRITPK